MYINSRAVEVEVARCLGVVVIVIDHQPVYVLLQIKPGLDHVYYLIEVVQVYTSKQTGRRMILQYLLSNVSKAKLERILIVRIQPEYRCVFLLVIPDVFDRQLSLSDSTETI